MKPVHTALAVGAIVLLFLAWNFKHLMKRSSKTATNVRADKLKMPMKKRPESIADEDSADSDDDGMSVLKGVLTLNRAAHVLTRSGAMLDKLLKKEKTAACEFLIREYDLSSVMVLTKKDEPQLEAAAKEEGNRSVQEGFKKLSTVKKESAQVKEIKDLSVSKPPINTDADADADDHKSDHHSANDPLDIALYCRNRGRVPRVGRVVRIVESEAERGTKYIIELVK